MKKLGIAVAVSAMFVAGATHANEDMTTWTLAGSVLSSVQTNLADLYADSTLTGSVSGIQKFDWRFISNDEVPFDDYGTFSLNGSPTMLASVSTVGDYTIGPWQTYTFATAFTGTLEFGVSNGGFPMSGWDDPDYASQLQIRNVTAVPEPETFAMMLTGLGLMGLVAGRRKRRAAG